jgi:hypothetical protein
VSTVAASTAPPSTIRPRKPSRRRMVVAMLIAAVLSAAGAYAAVQLTRDTAPKLTPGTPVIVPQGDIAAVARQVRHDIYGVPAPTGARLELTRGSNGEVWVRYLTGSAAPGDKRADFVTIGSYPRNDALAAAEEAAKGGDQRSAQLPGGGIMLWSLERPTSVYVARPGSDLLIEIYSPDAEQAKALARSGAVAPLR